MKLKLHHQIFIAMVLGAGVGLPLNILADPSAKFTLVNNLEADLNEAVLSPAILAAFKANAIELSNETSVEIVSWGDRWRVVDGMWIYHIQKVDSALTVSFGRVGEGWARSIAGYGKSVGDIFLRLLSMIIAPLIVTSLITGVTCTGSVKGLGKLGAGTLLYYISTSMIAIVTGIIAFNIIQPGEGADLELLEQTREVMHIDVVETGAGLGETLYNQLFNMIPTNPFSSLSDPGNKSILGVIFFALMFGIFITLVGGETGEFLTKFFTGSFEVMMRMTMFIIRFAPVGVLGFMLYASAGKGIAVFKALGWYALTVSLALSFHAFITLPLICLLLARRSPWKFFQSMSPALLTAFSTASSNGALPLTMTCVEERAGIKNRIGSFVLPLGATINMDGTALYEAVAVLFIAQVYGFELAFSDQIIIAITALFASIGAAGIPHAGTVMMVVVLGAVGLPLDGVGLILAVDRVLDMYRTSINVWSDSTACAVIARFDRSVET